MFLEPEVEDATREIQPRVQARGGGAHAGRRGVDVLRDGAEFMARSSGVIIELAGGGVTPTICTGLHRRHPDLRFTPSP